ncbi:hypothetical protein PIROE2DRAFT_6892 [Piromyces sp. E2]|nr:hypothetical protein PIROE2DRAFT_6892 [Piromyces sp. E2]|eukprot:OUM65999.1 hypothetical protein PIROE2DRAFT_6892 [Piromyces sp. E2]
MTKETDSNHHHNNNNASDSQSSSSKKDNRKSTISINILNPEQDITTKKLNRELLRKIKSAPIIDTQEIRTPIPSTTTPPKSKKSKTISSYSSFLPSFTLKSKHLSLGPKETISQDSVSTSSECSSSSPSISIPITSPSQPSSCPKRNINYILSSISQKSTNLSSFKQMQKKFYSSVALLPSKKEKVSRKGKEKLDWDSSEISIKIETESSFAATELPSGEVENSNSEIIIMPSTMDISHQKEKIDLFVGDEKDISDLSHSKSKSMVMFDVVVVAATENTTSLEEKEKEKEKKVSGKKNKINHGNFMQKSKLLLKTILKDSDDQREEDHLSK